MQVSTSTGSSATESSKGVAVFPLGQMALFVMVLVLFFLWGMSNNLTDILVQQFRKSFELSRFSAQLVSTANFTGYFCMAIPAALLMRRWGYKVGMVTGLCLFGAGMVLFWPAAVSGQYAPFLVALFAVGCGASILETAANPFMAQFGPSPTSERRLNFAQSFNPPGTILGVWIGQAVHPVGGGADTGAGGGEEGGGNVCGVFAHGDHARGADVHRAGVGGAAVCAGAVANAVSDDPERA